MEYGVGGLLILVTVHIMQISDHVFLFEDYHLEKRKVVTNSRIYLSFSLSCINHICVFNVFRQLFQFFQNRTDHKLKKSLASALNIYIY